MAVLTINFDNVSNGQELILPFDVSVTILAPINPPAGALTVSAVARQIDDNGLVNLGVTAGTSLPISLGIEVTTAECPDVNTWYMLTVYAWDSPGDCTLQSVTFKRISEPGPVPVPLPPVVPIPCTHP